MKLALEGRTTGPAIDPSAYTRRVASRRSGYCLIMPGKKYASIRNPRQYRALKRKGFSKRSAARITNASGRRRRRRK